MTIPLEKKIIHIGWQVAAPIIIALISGGIWAGKFIQRQEEMYQAIMKHGVILDSVYKWHMAGLSHRTQIDNKVGQIDVELGQLESKVDFLQVEYNLKIQHEALYTEKKVKGRVIFERVKAQTTK